jgi:hypothetical protein
VSLPITSHVLKFQPTARIALLAVLLRYETQFRARERKYPLEVQLPGIRAVFHAGSASGFSFDGWVDALWGSL